MDRTIYIAYTKWENNFTIKDFSLVRLNIFWDTIHIIKIWQKLIAKNTNFFLYKYTVQRSELKDSKKQKNYIFSVI